MEPQATNIHSTTNTHCRSVRKLLLDTKHKLTMGWTELGKLAQMADTSYSLERVQ